MIRMESKERKAGIRRKEKNASPLAFEVAYRERERERERERDGERGW